MAFFCQNSIWVHLDSFTGSNIFFFKILNKIKSNQRNQFKPFWTFKAKICFPVTWQSYAIWAWGLRFESFYSFFCNQNPFWISDWCRFFWSWIRRRLWELEWTPFPPFQVVSLLWKQLKDAQNTTEFNELLCQAGSVKMYEEVNWKVLPRFIQKTVYVRS